MNAAPGDHHIFGFIQSTHTGLHHTSREVASIDEIAMGAQMMHQRGHHDIGHITERWQGRTWDIPPAVRRSAMPKHFTHNFESPSDALTTAAT